MIPKNKSEWWKDRNHERWALIHQGNEFKPYNVATRSAFHVMQSISVLKHECAVQLSIYLTTLADTEA